jgi:hypothetical protein
MSGPWARGPVGPCFLKMQTWALEASAREHTTAHQWRSARVTHEANPAALAPVAGTLRSRLDALMHRRDFSAMPERRFAESPQRQIARSKK